MILLSSLLGLGACFSSDGADGAPGADGANGSNGTNGTDGTDGTNGTNGVDGASSLIALTDEAPGANCPAGGTRIDSGIDDDRDGVLDAGEVDSTAYLCDGVAGAATLSTTTVIDPGAICPAGGTRIDQGVDDDGDGVLDQGEIDSSANVCNGVAGEPGATGPTGPAGPAGSTSLITTSTEPKGANCEAGGIRVDHGIDDNGNGVLTASEIDGTSYVCNGVVRFASCAEIQSNDASAADGVYTLRIGNNNQVAYCDMTRGGVTYAELGFGRHSAVYLGRAEVASTDLQDPILQQAFIALYNAQGGGAINLEVGYASDNCCLQAADAVGNTFLNFGGAYLYPATTPGSEIRCNGTYGDAMYRFYTELESAFSPIPMPTDYFATRPVSLGSQCGVANNPAFFWRRF